jgi:ornithine--oxo-acid transaminase
VSKQTYVTTHITITYCQVDFNLLAISAVLSNQKVMSVLTPGTHGSIFGGNPLASAIGIEAFLKYHISYILLVVIMIL